MICNQLKKLYLFIHFHEPKYLIKPQEIVAPMHPRNPRRVNSLVDPLLCLALTCGTPCQTQLKSPRLLII